MRRLAIGAGLCAAAAALVLSAARDSRPPARREAERLFEEGLEHLLNLNYREAFEAQRQALLADPSYALPLQILVSDLSGSVPLLHPLLLIDSIAQRVADPAQAACIAEWARLGRGMAPRPDIASSSACVLISRAQIDTNADPPTSRSYPEFAALVSVHSRRAWAIDHRHQWEEGVRVGRALMRSDHHALVRVIGYAQAADALHRLNRHAEAVAIEESITADPLWQRLGGRLAWTRMLWNHVSLPLGPQPADPALLAHIAAAVQQWNAGIAEAVSHADTWGRAVIGSEYGRLLSDAGRLEAATPVLRDALAATRELNDRHLEAHVRLRIGRNLAKQGRRAAAESELLRARDLLANDTLPLTQKETEHNLLHLYESLGDDRRAREAGLAFVRYAAMGGLHPTRMMSARDLARFLRARGHLSESEKYFRRMVADIDSLREQAEFAGEYYELTGDLDRAREYYERASPRGLLAVEGLIRLALATGDTAEALAQARSHESLRFAKGLPETVPMLPSVLARLGRATEARSAFEAARKEARANGRLAAWSQLTLQLAQLERAGGGRVRAALLADSASVAARSVGEQQVGIRAVALATTVRVELDPTASRAPLEQAALDARRIGYPSLRAEVHRLHAEAHLARRVLGDALREYAAAARITDSVASLIAMDHEQAGYRSTQRLAYDGALSAIVRLASPAAAPALLADWTQRRKSRGSITSDRQSRSPPLSAGDVIVDYAVLDSSIAALIVTRERTSIAMLPLHPDSLHHLVRSLHDAMSARIGGMIDVSRLRYPLGVAHELYKGLVQPIESRFPHGVRLTIVPDGALHRVPFDGLVVDTVAAAQGAGGFLLDRYVIRQAATRNAPWEHVARNGVVLLASPNADTALQHEAQREQRAIERLVEPSRLRILVGERASKAALIAAAANDDIAILHFAGHARANSLAPRSSHIALAADARDAGLMFGHEIEQLRVKGALVVLSACETAGGRTLEGEGVLSLSRSFLRAGAAATIATMWDVGVGSAAMSEALYQPLRDGGTIADALRAAKLRMRRDGVPAYAWANYVLITR